MKNNIHIQYMNILITNSILNNFKLENTQYLVDESFYDLPSGQQEYHLYSYLSIFFNNTVILDIGTFDGRSAVALSHNPTNHVISYNIVDDIHNPNHVIYTKPNIEFKIKNVLDDLNAEMIKNVKLIVLESHKLTIDLKNKKKFIHPRQSLIGIE